MRWQITDDTPVLFADEGEVLDRRPGTGQFAGMEFLHVRAKRIINEIRGGAKHLPFQFTINVYRGCSHACSYCLVGETPILMADGRTKPLADVRPGDRVYGTGQRGRYRRYAITEVLDHWSTFKRAFRITLADGTQLIASGDHRFLTDRGWKHVTGSEQARHRRPHLTAHDRLIGTGQFADPHEQRAAKVETKIVDVEDLGVELPMFDITTGTGDFIANGVISHNCFARPTHAYLDMDIGDDFDRRIVVKVNAAERLRAELRGARWRGDHIAMGTNTDPYQRCEGKYRLTRAVLEVLAEAANPFGILTKSTLVLRDLDVLADAAARTDVHVNLSIGTLDEEVWRLSEPGTPHPLKRIDAVARLNEAGIRCGVLVAPVLPALSDSTKQINDVVKACAEAGAVSVTGVTLHLRPGVREHYLAWLERVRPDLVAHYQRLYPRAYAPADVRKRIAGTIRRAATRYGIPTHHMSVTRDPDAAPRRPTPAPVTQMALELG